MPEGHDDHDHKYHGHGPLIYDVYQDVNSLPLNAPFDKKERERHETTTKGSAKKARHVRQLINVLVGIAIGFCFFCLDLGSDTVAKFRVKMISTQLHLMGDANSHTEYIHHAIWASAIAIATYSVASFAAVLFVVWEPRSSSSGIPQIIAFLNGVNQKGVLCAKVMVAKFFGTMFSFGSGLCLGPEGPMIHLGAMIGLFVVRRMLRPILRYVGGPSGRKMEEELSRSPLRYDIQAAAMGAGAGVAAAFQAPLAGTMFVVEEASSFFSVKLFFHAFLTCCFAVGSSMVFKALFGKDLFTYYHRNSSCVGASLSWEVILHVSVVAIVGTLLALAFNNLIVWCNTKRALQNQRLKSEGRGKWGVRFVRVLEVLALAVVTPLFAVWLPAITQCQDASLQNVVRGSSGCVNDEWMFQIMHGTVTRPGQQPVDFWDRLRGTQRVTNESKYFPASGLYGVKFDPIECPAAINRNPEYQVNVTIPEDKREQWNPNFYCRGSDENGNLYDLKDPVAPLHMAEEAYLQGACPKVRDANGVQITQYSAGSSLWLVKPETVLKTLFTRGSPGLLPVPDLAMFLVGYGTLTAVTAGVWLPGGLLVPQLVIGGTIGRLIGELWVIAADLMHKEPNFPWAPEFGPLLQMLGKDYNGQTLNSAVAVPDPGTFALAGAAAFLASSGSLALFVLVLLLEITYDWLMMPVIVLAVIVARTCTTMLGSHGLYHRLIDVASLPFLDEHVHWRLSRWTAKDILAEDLRHAKEASNGDVESVEMEHILISVNKDATATDAHNVLDAKIPGNAKARPHGFPVTGPNGKLCGLVTREALVCLVKGEQRLTRGDGDEPVVEENVRHMFSTFSGIASRRTISTSEREAEAPIGVEAVMDSAPFVIQPSTPVHQIHTMFRQLGLRHVVVVDETHRPKGVLTRKSLMPWRCPTEPGVHDSFAAIRHARGPPRELAHPLVDDGNTRAA